MALTLMSKRPGEVPLSTPCMVLRVGAAGFDVLAHWLTAEGGVWALGRRWRKRD
jgi:hypothetical protein